MVITDPQTSSTTREPQKIGPRVHGYIVELADYNIQFGIKPGNTNTAMIGLGYPIWHQTRKTLVSGLPESSVCPPGLPV